jgi:hypothetical protein
MMHPSDIDDASVLSDTKRKGAFLAYFFGAKS